MLEIIQSEWALRALVASIMVGLTCGVLGCFIVLRNMALIGDALSHAILPGVVLAFVLFGYSVLGFFAGSVLAGLLAAVLITWIQQNIKTKNDAAIGIVFTAMFSVGVIGISWISKNEGVHLDLKDFLFGNVLGVSNQDLWLTAAITIYVLLSILVFYRYLFVSTFQPVIAETMGISVKTIHYFLMLLLSFVVVASLQTVGVILVVAMLVTPAATALLITNRLHKVLLVAGLTGILAAVLGLVLAIRFNTVPGPAMAVVATVFYLMAALFAPGKGLVFRLYQKRKLQTRIREEDVLKNALRLNQNGELSFENLSARLPISKGQLKTQFQKLQNKGYFEKNGFELSEKGMEEANRLVRAHRLWETYLVQEIGLSEEQIHEEAEKYEHLLTAEILDEVDAHLGFPSKDPHGSPIPNRMGKAARALAQLEKGKKFKILANQEESAIVSRLWKLGVQSSAEYTVEDITEQDVIIRHGDEIVRIPKEIAARVGVEQ